MASAQPLKCIKREVKNKSYLKTMKKGEWVPGVVYSGGQEAVPIFIGSRELFKVFNRYGSRGLFTLEIEGEGKPVFSLIRELQKHPLSGAYMHIDFLGIKMDVKIKVNVSIHITGEEEISHKGGIVQMGARELEVECLPMALPNYLNCDIANLNIGDNITVGDLELPEGVELISEPDQVVVSILAPSLEEAPEQGEAAEEEAPAEEEK